MRIVTANELGNWLSDGCVLEQDSRGPKVVRLQNGKFLKVFRSKRPLLARYRPEAKRFARNGQRLDALGVRTPNIIECIWLQREQGVSACLYEPLQGAALETLFREQRERFDRLLPEFAAYIRSLHSSGIYFRSLHLGNVLLMQDGSFGLIDFLDLRIKSGDLSKGLVARNFEHLRNYLQRRNIEGFPWEKLIELYKRN